LCEREQEIMGGIREISGKALEESGDRERVIAFGDMRFVIRTGELRSSGNAARLTPRAAAVLELLVEHAPQLVTKEELIARVWDGKAVGDEALTSCIQELRRALNDDARQPRYIETRYRRGYRLVAPVTGRSATSANASASKPSIAVLPLVNMSGDPEQEHFVDGIAEDIITALSRFRELFVIARNSSFTYKGRAVDIRQVGRELGVLYVLEGSSRKIGNRVRVAAQLIDCESGNHLWVERYDRELVDIFAVQEEIARSVVSRIAPAMEALAIARARRLGPGNLNAHELALRAWHEADTAYVSADPAARERARTSAGQALALDADCVLAWVTIAYLCWQSVFYSQERTREVCQPGLDAARQAIELDRFEHRAYMFRGLLHLEFRSYDDALSDLRHACELNPSDALALQVLAWGELRNGDAQLAKEHGLESLRLNPQDPMRYNTTSFLAHVCVLTGEYAEGLKWVAESRRIHPDFRPTIQAAVKLHVGLGQLDRARAEVDRIRSPLLQERIRKGISLLRRPEHREREIRFYRIALGLPDPVSTAEASPMVTLSDKPTDVDFRS
jgi:TolB-like protein/Flp pilus assembly protein TadD